MLKILIISNKIIMDFEETEEYIFTKNILLIKPSVDLFDVINRFNLTKNKVFKIKKIVLLDNIDKIKINDLIIYSEKKYEYLYYDQNNYYKDTIPYLKTNIHNNYVKYQPNIFNKNYIDLIDTNIKDFIIQDKTFNIEIKFPKNIKMIKLSDSYNNNINIHETLCECFIMGNSFNNKICLPDTLIYLEIGLTFDKEIGLPNKLKFIVLNNNINNLIDYLPNSVEYLKINSNPNLIRQNYNFDNLPNSIKILSISVIILQDFNSYVPEFIKDIEIIDKYVFYDILLKNVKNFTKKIKYCSNINIIILQQYYIFFSVLSYIKFITIASLTNYIMNNIISKYITYKIYLYLIINLIINLISLLYSYGMSTYLIFICIIWYINILKKNKINKYNLWLLNKYIYYNYVTFNYYNYYYLRKVTSNILFIYNKLINKF